jgi:hypothetical protein
VCWAVQHGQRREGFVLREIFLVRHAQSVAGDAIIVKNGPGEASSHESDDGQPDLRAPVRGCKPERNGRRRCQEEAFVRPGEQQKYGARAEDPRQIAGCFASHDSAVCTYHESASDGRHCPAPVAVHPVAEDAEVEADERSKECPAGWQPTLHCPAQGSCEQAATEPDAGPGLACPELSAGHGESLSGRVL